MNRLLQHQARQGNDPSSTNNGVSQFEPWVPCNDPFQCPTPVELLRKLERMPLRSNRDRNFHLTL
jgi:hypothetical protein